LTNFAIQKKRISKSEEARCHGDENPEINLTDEETQKLQVKVFDIEFAFNNHKLINILKKRGAAITKLDFE
jgi:hypothetical protein